MKTPKRYYELTTMEHAATERVWDRPQEDVSAQRWKRKNRIKQLKRTIKRLIKEREHLKKLLAIRTIDDVIRARQETLVYAKEHLSVETHKPEIKEDEFGNWLYVIKRPVVKWDGKPIL